MSTHCSIAMLLPTGKVRSIYCHYDGYTSHTGEILLAHYSTLEAVSQLLDLGDLGCLNSTVKTCEQLAYGGPADLSEKSQYLDDRGQEYNYLFQLGQWWVNFRTNDSWVLLSEVRQDPSKYSEYY